MQFVRMASAICISLFAVLALGLAAIAGSGGPQMSADQFIFMILLNPGAGLVMAAAAWAATMQRLHQGLLNLGMVASAIATVMAIRFSWLIAEGQMPGIADAPLILATAPILGLLWGGMEKITRWRER